MQTYVTGRKRRVKCKYVFMIIYMYIYFCLCIHDHIYIVYVFLIGVRIGLYAEIPAVNNYSFMLIYYTRIYTKFFEGF